MAEPGKAANRSRTRALCSGGSDALAMFAVDAKRPPSPWSDLGLAFHRFLAFGRRRVDPERIEKAANGGGPAHGELVVEDAYGFPARGMEPLLPPSVPEMKLVEQVLNRLVVVFDASASRIDLSESDSIGTPLLGLDGLPERNGLRHFVLPPHEDDLQSGEDGVEPLVERQIAQTRQFPHPQLEVVEVVPHHFGAEHTVEGGASLEYITEPVLEIAGLLGTSRQGRRESVGDV